MEWDLKDIYESPKDCKTQLIDLGSRIDSFESNELPYSISEINEYAAILGEVEKVAAYVTLFVAKDQNNVEVEEIRGIADALSARLSKIEAGIAKDKETLRVIGEQPMLSGYCKALSISTLKINEAAAENVIHNTSVFNSKNWQGLYRKAIQNARSKQGRALAEVRRSQQSQSWNERHMAAVEEAEICESVSDIARRALFGIKAENHTIATLRGYKTVLDERLDEEGISRPLFDDALQNVNALLPLLQEALQKKFEQVEPGTPHWVNMNYIKKDTNCEADDVELEFALDIIRTCAGELSKDMLDTVDKMINDGMIDTEILPGKRSGAFCCNLYVLNSTYVCVNYTNNLDGFISFAHEFGHALHYSLLNKLPILAMDVSISLKEGFAHFFERLALKKLLELAPQHEARIREKELTSLFGGLLDCFARYKLESEYFLLCEKMEMPTASKIYELSKQVQESIFGTKAANAANAWSWISKPHLYYPNRPFYNYPYMLARLFSYQMLYSFESNPKHVDLAFGVFAQGNNVTFEQAVNAIKDDGKAKYAASSWADASFLISTFLMSDIVDRAV